MQRLRGFRRVEQYLSVIGLKITVPDGLVLQLDKTLLRKAFQAAGQIVAKNARRNISQMFRLDNHNPKSRMPLLAGSLRSRLFKTGDGVAIRARTPVALWLDRGAVGVGRPRKGTKAKRKGRGVGVTQRVLVGRLFMEKAMDEAVSAGLADRLKESVLKGLQLLQKGK